MIYRDIITRKSAITIDFDQRAYCHNEFPVPLNIFKLTFLRWIELINNAWNIRISSLKIFHKIILKPAFYDNLIPDYIFAPLIIKVNSGIKTIKQIKSIEQSAV